MDTNGASGAIKVPPYVGYKTFCTVLDELKVGGLPNRIDRSVLTRFSGGVGSQVLAALRSLDLIDADGRPQPQLRRLIEARGAETWRGELRQTLWRGFPFLADADLSELSPSQFNDLFKPIPAGAEVVRKARTFFLHAASDAGISVTSRVLKGTRQRSSGPRKARTAGRKRGRAEGLKKPPENAVPAVAYGFKEHLLTKFPAFDPAWPDELKTQWFDGFKTLLRMVPDSSGEPQE